MKSIAGKKIVDFEEFAVHSNILRKLASMIYSSELYQFFSRKITEFKDLKILEEAKKNKTPEHVAIIMDGNRRFAEGLGLSSTAGHRFGTHKLEEVLDWCFELKIKNLTVYAFSTENFKRNNQEVKLLMDLCKKELDQAANDSRLHKNRVKVRVIGNLDYLPDQIKNSAHNVMNKTKDYNNYSFNIALAYGGREEILQAIQKIAEDVKKGKISVSDIKEEIVSKYLYTNGIPDPDIILRTSGEERISNFLLWQLAYSELYFSDVFWPAFQKRDFLKAIRTYQRRNRRYGK